MVSSILKKEKEKSYTVGPTLLSFVLQLRSLSWKTGLKVRLVLSSPQKLFGFEPFKEPMIVNGLQISRCSG